MNLTNIKIFLLGHYSLHKLLLKKLFPNVYKDESPTIVAQIPILTITVLFLMISIPILILFYCYKRLVTAILKYRHNSKFAGLITGCDFLISFNNKNGLLLSTVLFVESEKEGEDLFREISKKIWDEFTDKDMDKRLVSIRKSFMGYLYFKEVDNLNSNDVLHCIRLDKSVIREEELTEVLNYHCNVKPLPLNGTFTWDFSIVATPLRLNNGETRYIMILRMQHFIVDALTMHNLIKRITVANGDDVAYGDNMSSKLKIQQKQRTVSTNLKTISFFTFPVPITESQMKCKRKPKAHLSILVEQTQNYVLKLKEIKSKIPGASFNALLLTAYSASLADYFKEFTPKNVEIPTKLEIVAPIQINVDRFSKHFGSKRITKIGNDFTLMTMDIPIVPADKRNIPIENYVTERLEMIVSNFQDYNNSIDYMFNYISAKTYLEVFTTKIASAVLYFTSFNIIMSIVPGGPSKSLHQGDAIKNALFMAPLQANKMDINFYALSYDDKFQFVQTIDENKFESVEKMDDVLKGIFKYIDILYDRIVKTN